MASLVPGPLLLGAKDRLALLRCLVELQKKKEAKPELIRKAQGLIVEPW
jgi:hypothetical protein